MVTRLSPSYPVRVPRDAFEAALFLRAIRREVESWSHVEASVSGDGAGGVWILHVSPRPDPEAPFAPKRSLFDRPQIDGRIWLVETGNGPAVEWRLSAHQSNRDSPPAIFDWAAEEAAADAYNWAGFDPDADAADRHAAIDRLVV